MLLCCPVLTLVLTLHLGFSCRELVQVARLSEQFLSEQEQLTVRAAGASTRLRKGFSSLWQQLTCVRCLRSNKALADSDWAELKQCTGWKEPTPVHPTCLQKHTQGLFQRKLISWLQERASISPESTACAVVLTQCDQPERQAQGRAEQRASLTVQGYPSDPSKALPLGLPLPLARERHQCQSSPLVSL